MLRVDGPSNRIPLSRGTPVTGNQKHHGANGTLVLPLEFEQRKGEDPLRIILSAERREMQELDYQTSKNGHENVGQHAPSKRTASCRVSLASFFKACPTE